MRSWFILPTPLHRSLQVLNNKLKTVVIDMSLLFHKQNPPTAIERLVWSHSFIHQLKFPLWLYKINSCGQNPDINPNSEFTFLQILKPPARFSSVAVTGDYSFWFVEKDVTLFLFMTVRLVLSNAGNL